MLQIEAHVIRPPLGFFQNALWRWYRAYGALLWRGRWCLCRCGRSLCQRIEHIPTLRLWLLAVVPVRLLWPVLAVAVPVRLPLLLRLLRC